METARRRYRPRRSRRVAGSLLSLGILLLGFAIVVIVHHSRRWFRGVRLIRVQRRVLVLVGIGIGVCVRLLRLGVRHEDSLRNVIVRDGIVDYNAVTIPARVGDIARAVVAVDAFDRVACLLGNGVRRFRIPRNVTVPHRRREVCLALRLAPARVQFIPSWDDRRLRMHHERGARASVRHGGNSNPVTYRWKTNRRGTFPQIDDQDRKFRRTRASAPRGCLDRLDRA